MHNYIKDQHRTYKCEYIFEYIDDPIKTIPVQAQWQNTSLEH